MKFKIFPSVFSFIGATLLIAFFVFDGFYVLKKDTNFDSKIYTLDSDGSVQAYFINLDKSKDRLEYVLPQLKELGYNFERIPAIYGKDLPEEIRKKLADYEKFKQLNKRSPDPGTIGCYLSHVETWKTFLKSNHKYAIIFEDDVKFEPKELRKIIDKVIQAKSNWDIVSMDLLHNGFPSLIEKIAEPNYMLAKYRARVSHTGCYIISRSAAIKLLSKALPILMPVDHYLVRSWELGTTFRGVEPRVIHQEFGDSEIAKQNIKSTNTVSILNKVRSGIFHVKTDLTMFIYSFLS